MPAKKSADAKDELKILVFGDVVGKIARRGIAQTLPELKKKYKPDLVIANAENLSHGLGATTKHIKEMQVAGVEVFTSGNHIWDKEEIFPYLAEKDSTVLRPANYPAELPGSGEKILTVGDKKVLLINIIGRVFMKPVPDDPFRCMKLLKEKYKHEDFAAILVDFHAEATSEKVAMGHFLDGWASAVWGTHTHVPTADGRILPGGTAYISDIGMTGAKDSVIGVKKEIVLYNFLNIKGRPHDIVENGTCEINGIMITIKATDGKGVSVERFYQEVEI